MQIDEGDASSMVTIASQALQPLNPAPQGLGRRFAKELTTERAAGSSQSQVVNESQVPASESPEAQTDQRAYSQQQVYATNRQDAPQSRYQYYPTPTAERLPPVPQRAVEAYNRTQMIGRESDASGDYLGSIDLFV